MIKSLDAHEIAYYAVRGTDGDPVKDVAGVEYMIRAFAKTHALNTLHRYAKLANHLDIVTYKETLRIIKDEI